MNALDFFSKYDGQYAKWSGGLGGQCEDLAELYNEEVVHGIPFTGNAVDAWTTYDHAKYDKIAIGSSTPILGDIVVWGTGIGQYGHIAICKEANSSTFISFDQNWPIGSLCHLQHHDFVNVLGWLHPISNSTPMPCDPHTEYLAGVVLGTTPHGAYVTPNGTGYALIECKSEDQLRALMHLGDSDPIPYQHVPNTQVGGDEAAQDKINQIKQIIS